MNHLLVSWICTNLSEFFKFAQQRFLSFFSNTFVKHTTCMLFLTCEDILQVYYILCCTGVLEVLQCVLVESPEAINVIKEGHIQSTISFLNKHGYNHKVETAYFV